MVSNRRKRGGTVRNGPPSGTLFVTGVRAGEIESPDDQPVYALEIMGISISALDRPELEQKEITRGFVLSRENLHSIVAELHKAEGIA
jgi:hypothetical protein